MRGPVPNRFPSRESACRVALVGESPGETELSTGLPFSGTAGWALNTALSWAGLSREECFIGNVCQWRPSATSNEFDLLDWAGEEVQSGITQLLLDLASFRPNVVVCLGNVPLHLFRHGNVAPPRGGAKEGKVAAIKWPSKVSAWRGSLFNSSPLLTATISPPPYGSCPPPSPATPPLPLGLPTGATPTGLLSPEERSEAHHNTLCGVPTGGVDAATDTAPNAASPLDCASGGGVVVSLGRTLYPIEEGRDHLLNPGLPWHPDDIAAAKAAKELFGLELASEPPNDLETGNAVFTCSSLETARGESPSATNSECQPGVTNASTSLDLPAAPVPADSRGAAGVFPTCQYRADDSNGEAQESTQNNDQ